MQLLVPFESFELDARWREAEEAHAAVDRPDRGIHAGAAKHAAEIDLVVVEVEFVVQFHLQHHIQGLVEQPALDGVVVVLQEGADQFMGFAKLLQGELDPLYTPKTLQPGVPLAR